MNEDISVFRLMLCLCLEKLISQGEATSKRQEPFLYHTNACELYLHVLHSFDMLGIISCSFTMERQMNFWIKGVVAGKEMLREYPIK